MGYGFVFVVYESILTGGVPLTSPSIVLWLHFLVLRWRLFVTEAVALKEETQLGSGLDGPNSIMWGGPVWAIHHLVIHTQSRTGFEMTD